MVRGVPLEIARMKHQLERIEEFISIADKVADAEENNKKDVIDEYTIREEQQLPDPGCAAFAANYVKTVSLRLQIAYKIQNIKSRIDEIKDTSNEKDDGFPQIQSSWKQGSSSCEVLYNIRSSPFHIDEADVVGFEEPNFFLIDWLVEGRAERTVLSVVAMGGQGKTTLAKNVFDRNMVIKHFDCRVWITVSQSYNVEELLKDLLQKLYKQNGQDPPRSINQMDRDSLVDEVKNCLQHKRY
ncbi:hypothetical protein TSUD_153310 [Trifolium subterraneum]|uniref:NB-ARC domain-containing protein n=1 Tax=Trifolium subterraneum TaxID=3900 RepID=A0A2Z6MCN7_TRISU|nr:hypothetical protein TSUD_153310 [Trifolium subterraneum]